MRKNSDHIVALAQMFETDLINANRLQPQENVFNAYSRYPCFIIPFTEEHGGRSEYSWVVAYLRATEALTFQRALTRPNSSQLLPRHRPQKHVLKAAADDINISVEEFEAKIAGIDWDPIAAEVGLTAPKTWDEVSLISAPDLVHLLRKGAGIIGKEYDMNRWALPGTPTADVWRVD